MSVREIQGHLLELYGLQVSPDLISMITDEVLTKVEQWQQRPLEATLFGANYNTRGKSNCRWTAMYSIVYLDALRLNIGVRGAMEQGSQLSPANSPDVEFGGNDPSRPPYVHSG